MLLRCHSISVVCSIGVGRCTCCMPVSSFQATGALFLDVVVCAVFKSVVASGSDPCQGTVELMLGCSLLSDHLCGTGMTGCEAQCAM